MNLGELLTSETALSLAASAIGGVWTLFKSGEVYARLRQRRIKRALRILESAAESTYRTYVRQIKKAGRDGKLTEEEIRQARQLAKERAIQIARRKGMNLMRALGEEFLELGLTRAVNRLKGRTL